MGKRMRVALGMFWLLLAAACVPMTEVGQPTAESEPPISVEQEPPAQPVTQGEFARLDLPTDLRPRGVGHGYYAGTPLGESSLYLVDLETEARMLVSENGGWGDVVLLETAVYWLDEAGHLHEYQFANGDTRRLTTVEAERFELVGNERSLAWRDKRNELGEENYYAGDIYAYDLQNGLEIAVAVAAGVQQQPAIWQNTVVWADNRNSSVQGEPLEGCANCPDNPFGIYSYDLLTGETAVLVEDGRNNGQPTIDAGRVAWVTAGEGVRVLDLASGEVETAVSFGQDFQLNFARPRLHEDNLYYVISQPCDVMIVDASGEVIEQETGLFRYDLLHQQTDQLTAYVEPFAQFGGEQILVAEGCMIGFENVYLLMEEK